MSQYLAITLQTPNEKALVDLTQLIDESESYVVDSQVIKLGIELSCSILVTGNWKTIGQLEESLQKYSPSEGQLITRRTKANDSKDALLPYEVEATALNSPSLLFCLCKFFDAQKVSVRELISKSFITQRTNTEMLHIKIQLDIPGETFVPDLRETFLEYCDELNIDATIDPIRE